jgi:hypothetical protein
MSTDLEDVFLAGRLVQWGLRPRSRPGQEPEYTELLKRFFDQSEFRNVVRETARGLGLLVLDATDNGIVLAPEADSAFALRPADFLRTSSADDRLVAGLVQIGIAAAVFPKGRDLDDDPAIARPPVTVDDVEDVIRRICQRLEEETRGAPDPAVSEDGGLLEAWRVYQRRLASMETGDNRAAQRATRRNIESALERLRDHGCFVIISSGGQQVFQPTWRYQVLVRGLAASNAYEKVRHLLDGGSAVPTA